MQAWVVWVYYSIFILKSKFSSARGLLNNTLKMLACAQKMEGLKHNLNS
jgi:hypothetical protein